MFARPYIVMDLFKSFMIWHGERSDRTIYLTFDDGPTPFTTPYILEILEKKEVKATFFCVGNNVKKFPRFFEELVDLGHEFGNHTFHHLNGWKSPLKTYVDDVLACENYFQTPFFRPPYGRITHFQFKEVSKRYKVVMWDTLSMDYLTNEPASVCLRRTIRFTKPGSIVVFHDNIKTKEKLQEVLPAYIDFLKQEGYSFGLISNFVLKGEIV